MSTYATVEEANEAWKHAETFWPLMFPDFDGPPWARHELTLKTFKVVLEMRGLKLLPLMKCAGGDEPERQQRKVNARC